MPIKGARGLIPLAFYLAVTIFVSSAICRLTKKWKNLESLSESVKSIKDKLAMLEHRAHTGV